MPEIRVNDIVIDVVRKDIKNLHLAVQPPFGRVRIAAPMHMHPDAIRLFAIAKLDWIKKHQRKFAQQERQGEREYVSGESHYFQGIRYWLQVVPNASENKVVIRNKTHLDLFVKANGDTNQRQRVMDRWYRQQLQVEIGRYLLKWQSLIGVEMPSIRIKQMKTRWGSCNITDRRIWINLELVKKPLRCLEYVMVHELTHLLERTHNARFIAYLDKFLPLWRIHRDELNNFVLEHAVW